MTLAKETRDAIGRTVRSLRGLFEDEFSKQASGRFGIRSGPRDNATDPHGLQAHLDPAEALSLTPAEFAQRDELVHALRYLVAEGSEPGEAVTRLVREAAFTAVNRLLAVRVAEAIGVLPPALSGGRQSAGYRDTVGDLFPGLAHDPGSYWTYLQVAGDELAPGVPRLFDRRHPTSAFVPSRAAVDQALGLLAIDELAEAWDEPETLGWGYQFFNGDDVKQMRDASSAPRNSRELAVRNQFFTPRYVVDWLVQNTLGRRLAQAGYELDLPLLVGEVGDQEPLALEDVRVLDPAVGSGHFLLGSYDLLEKAWQSTGVSPEDAASRILPCLFGIEIDPRAAQVAQAVLLLRARRFAPNADLTAPTIVTAVALPHSKELREQAFGGLSPAARHLADEITEALDQAPLLGSLLKVEQRLATELASHQAAPRLAVDGTEANVLEELHRALDELVSAAATPEQRMFTAEAADALRFLEICQQRYDTVLMNPPFGDSVPSTKGYLKAAYGPAATDIYAAFVSRGVELLRPHGHVGAITSRTGFFLTSFRDWRADELLPRLRAMLDLGVGVMHDAMVEAASYVLQHRPHSGTATFRRLIDEPDLARAVYAGDGPTFERAPQDFKAIPEQPAAYWLPAELLVAIHGAERVESPGRSVRVGLQTSDDFRFVRLRWECEHSANLGRWFPFVKGGEYSPYDADVYLYVDWEDDGARIRQFHSEDLGYSETRLVRSSEHYGRPGLTWSARSQKGFSVRAVPAGTVFGHKGPMLVVADDNHEDLRAALSYLNSSLAASVLEAMVAFGSYEVGAVQRLPWCTPTRDAAESAEAIISELRGQRSRVEVDHLGISPWHGTPAETERLAELSQRVDDDVSARVELNHSPAPLSATFPTRWFVEGFEPVGTPGLQEELSYMLGSAFGRWDMRYALGTTEPPPMPGPFAPVPLVPRGMLVGPDGIPSSQPPDDYPIDLPPDRLLHDDPGHPQDIVAALDDVCELLEASPAVPALALADVRDLRKHLRDKFFAAHLNEYSASRRYAPIYWQFAVPTKRWGIWLYAPSLSRESLFAIARAGREKLSSVNEQIGRARDRSETDRDERERAESLEDLAAEVEKFASIADEVAQSGWEPDLNDGFVLNAAPLEELFVEKKWLRQIAKHRKAMQKGEYPWATVQRDYFEKRR